MTFIYIKSKDELYYEREKHRKERGNHYAYKRVLELEKKNREQPVITYKLTEEERKAYAT